MNDRFLARRRATLALMLAALPFSGQAKRQALPPEVASALPDAQLVGQGKLRYLGLHIYDIRLWSPRADLKTSAYAAPLALELTYARALDGKAIAERTLKEMQGIDTVGDAQGERWLTQMQQIFPDVKPGDRLTGVQRPGEAALFFVNGEPRGEVRDAEFTRLFFGIWLSPRTSQPRLREALLGTRSAAS